VRSAAWWSTSSSTRTSRRPGSRPWRRSRRRGSGWNASWSLHQIRRADRTGSKSYWSG